MIRQKSVPIPFEPTNNVSPHWTPIPIVFNRVRLKAGTNQLKPPSTMHLKGQKGQKSHLNNRIAFCLLRDDRDVYIRYIPLQRVSIWIRQPIFSRTATQQDDVLICHPASIRQYEPRFALAGTDLAGHFGDGVQGVVVACAAEGCEAAEESERGLGGEGEVLGGEFGDDGEAAVVGEKERVSEDEGGKEQGRGLTSIYRRGLCLPFRFRRWRGRRRGSGRCRDSTRKLDGARL